MTPNSRRDFLKLTSLAALGASLSLDLRAQPAPRKQVKLNTRELAPGEKFGIGIIGCGNRAKAHVASIRQVPQMEIRALCDLLPEAMAELRKEVRGSEPALHRDYRKLLEDPRIDAVLVVTPNDTHKVPVIAALAAGKHVLCEKPMALYPADCDEMIAAQEKAGRVLLVGTQRRHSPTQIDFVRRLHEGAIGTVLSAWMNDFRRDWRRMYKTEAEEIRGNWRYSNERSGGLAFEMSIHGIDHCNWIMASAPVEVVAMGGVHNPRLRQRESSDHLGLVVRYANGAQLTYGASLYSAGGYGPDVVSGTNGSAFIVGDRMEIRRMDYGMVGGAGEIVPKESIELPSGNTNVKMHEHFVAAMQGKVTPTADGHEGKMAVEIARAAEISSREKRFVSIPRSA
jgi:predicted dehydrogenase